jgi:prevent-host-death family protein
MGRFGMTSVMPRPLEVAMSRKIKAPEFKAKCLALVDEVARTRKGILITKNGKPVAELVPYGAKKRNANKPNALGILKDKLFITGDIILPIDVKWDALK